MLAGLGVAHLLLLFAGDILLAYGLLGLVLVLVVRAGEAALRSAEGAFRLARQRLSVADQQLDVARRAFRQGETGIFDLYRVRQLQLEAAGAEARAAVQAGRARSRLNQALGVVPGV